MSGPLLNRTCSIRKSGRGHLVRFCILTTKSKFVVWSTYLNEDILHLLRHIHLDIDQKRFIFHFWRKLVPHMMANTTLCGVVRSCILAFITKIGPSCLVHQENINLELCFKFQVSIVFSFSYAYKQINKVRWGNERKILKNHHSISKKPRELSRC